MCQIRIIHNSKVAVRNPYGERRAGLSLVGCVNNTKQFAVLSSGQNFVSSGGFIRCRILPTSDVTFCTCSALRIWSVSAQFAGLGWFIVLSATASFVLPVAEDGQRTRKRGSCGFFVSVPCVQINDLKEQLSAEQVSLRFHKSSCVLPS